MRFPCRARTIVIDAFANWPLRPGDAQTHADCLRLPSFSLPMSSQLFLAPHAYMTARVMVNRLDGTSVEVKLSKVSTVRRRIAQTYFCASPASCV